MSRIGGQQVKAPDGEHYTITGRILGGSGVASIKAGKGFSLTYVSAGRYRITTDVNFPKLQGGHCNIMSSADATLAFTCGIKAYVQGGAGTSVDFEVLSAGVATDLGAAEELWFSIECARTVQP